MLSLRIYEGRQTAVLDRFGEGTKLNSKVLRTARSASDVLFSKVQILI